MRFACSLNLSLFFLFPARALAAVFEVEAGKPGRLKRGLRYLVGGWRGGWRLRALFGLAAEAASIFRSTRGSALSTPNPLEGGRRNVSSRSVMSQPWSAHFSSPTCLSAQTVEDKIPRLERPKRSAMLRATRNISKHTPDRW